MLVREIFRTLMISRAFWVAAAAVALALHLWWARTSHHGSDLARCGALWAIFGAVLLARPVVRLRFGPWFDETRSHDDGVYYGTPEQLAAMAEAEKQARLDAIAQQILGPALIVAGTLLWGYGDLIGDWLFGGVSGAR